MVKAFVAEIDSTSGTLYLGAGGKLKALPYFWQSSKALKDALTRPTSLTSKTYSPSQQYLTQVIEIFDLEKGLRQTKLERMSVRQFLEKFATPIVKKPHPNSVFKVRTEKSPTGKAKFFGQSKAKFGKTWSTAGALRNQLSRIISSSNLEHLQNWIVLELQMKDDGIQYEKVIETPLVDFYCQSTDCKKRYEQEVKRRILLKSVQSYKPKSDFE